MYFSVSVSAVTIKGTECDLLHIGQVANLSGGNVLSYLLHYSVDSNRVQVKHTSLQLLCDFMLLQPAIYGDNILLIFADTILLSYIISVAPFLSQESVVHNCMIVDVKYVPQVDVVDPMSLTDEFVNILSTSVVAVRVNAKIILHSTLQARPLSSELKLFYLSCIYIIMQMLQRWRR